MTEEDIKKYIDDFDVDINDIDSVNWHLTEITALIKEDEGDRTHPLYELGKYFYTRFKELQPL